MQHQRLPSSKSSERLADVLNEALLRGDRVVLERHGRLAIFNTDEGAQLTSAAFNGLLHEHGIQISVDGKGCWSDNIFVEWLWRSLTYEEVYFPAYAAVAAATAGIARYFTLDYIGRPHSSLTDLTPDDAYVCPFPRQAAACPPPALLLSHRARLYRKAEPLHLSSSFPLATGKAPPNPPGVRRFRPAFLSGCPSTPADALDRGVQTTPASFSNRRGNRSVGRRRFELFR